MKVNNRRERKTNNDVKIVNDRISAYEMIKVLAIEKDIDFSIIAELIDRRDSSFQLSVENLNLRESEIEKIADNLGYKFVQYIEGKEHLQNAGRISKQFNAYYFMCCKGMRKNEIAKNSGTDHNTFMYWFKNDNMKEHDIFDMADAFNVRYVRQFVDKETGEVYKLSSDLFKKIKQGLSLNGFHIFDLMNALNCTQEEVKDKVYGIALLTESDIGHINALTGFNLTLNDFIKFRESAYKLF